MVRDVRARFIAAKVNINRNIFSANKERLISLIPDAITPSHQYQKGSWTWKFADINPFVENNVEYIFANLVKSRYQGIDVLDGDKTTRYEIPKPVANKAKFLYDSKHEILIFEETADIRRDDFLQVFEQLIYAGNIEIGQIIVKLIPIKEEIFREIMSMEFISKVEFEFIPPNFIEKKTYKKISEIIKDENATRMKVSLENKDGLNKNGDLINQGIAMVSNAYGDVKAYGYDYLPSRSKKLRGKRKPRNFNSKNSIHMKKIKTEDEKSLIEKLKEFASEMVSIIW
ncbi:hypothetical protein [Brevibacillus sp. MER 51]|uniref:hypothetical protein n=1 Tax=Brevibacillus sp. MER 51 TaxID=2939560 RepID=UPI00203B9B21|nr:hypothetical protein [Brevibacillus sp. MER 51]MCM3144689.1 hypothetical protein [Brevibacillus sp. MER 51]